jgi:DNA-binding IclR family transcriptional regulator
MLSVWGAAGPVVIRWQRADPQLITALGVGAVLPVTTSATGRVFLGWQPPALMARWLESPDSRVIELREAIREEFIVPAAQSYIPGLYALAVPVLGLDCEMAAAVTLVGTDPAMIEPGSAARAALLARFGAPQRAAM